MELLVVVAAVVGLLAVAHLCLPRLAPFFVFYPEPLEPHETQPRYWGFVDASEVWIPTEDGPRLHAWWFPAGRDEPGRGAAIYFHGNAGHLGDRGTVAAALSNLNLDVLLPDYRGYGASEGKPSEEGLYADARAAYRWLVDEKGVDPGRLILFGNSLGSAVAADLAIGRPVAGVVLLGPFTDIPAIARHRLSWLPEWYLDWPRPRFDTVDRASRIAGAHPGRCGGGRSRDSAWPEPRGVRGARRTEPMAGTPRRGTQRHLLPAGAVAGPAPLHPRGPGRRDPVSVTVPLVSLRIGPDDPSR